MSILRSTGVDMVCSRLCPEQSALTLVWGVSPQSSEAVAEALKSEQISSLWAEFHR